MNERKPIFYDKERLRWKRTRRTIEISGAVLTVFLVIFFVTIIKRVSLPEVIFPMAHAGFHSVSAQPKPVLRRRGRRSRVAALGQVPPASYDPLRVAFYVSWDTSSFASLQQHFRDIDLLIPEQLHSISPDGRLDAENDTKLSSWMQQIGIEIPTMPLLNNSDGTVWHLPEMSAMLHDPVARRHLIEQSVARISASHQAGLTLDFEQVPDKSQADFAQFVREAGVALHAANLKLMVSVPPDDDSCRYADIAKASDAVIVMNYDQHWLYSDAGPIAPQDWFTDNLQDLLKKIPKEKMIMGVANYAYDWPDKKGVAAHEKAQSLSFEEAMVTAVESEATVDFDSDSLNPHYSYSDEKDHVHNVWLLDGVTVYNQVRAAEGAGVRGTALWRLGSEDPSLWSIWDLTRPTDAARSKLAELLPGYDLILEGSGDVWRITATPQKGQRTFRFDAGMQAIVDEDYVSMPLSYRIEQLGGSQKKIALSFDDGPDPRNTPKILDILKEKQVPATFFVIGSAANDNLGLLKREYDEGNEIGNHTYTHPEINDVTRTQLELELNLTERLFASTLGIKTLLFRPPYGIDHQPETASDVSQLPLPQSMGYLLVGQRIDPHDWGEVGGVPPAPAMVIVQRVLEQARKGVGNIVLLHDGGGDRHTTVEALPQIIDGLRAQGFELVPVSDLIGRTRAQVMVPLTFRERLVARADGLIFTLYEWLRFGIAWIFILGIALVSARALIIGVLALIEKLRPDPPADPNFQPPVSVLIPAYNEQEVIVATVQSALNCDYPGLEVVVVNDGSSDETGALLDSHFSHDPRVRLIHQPNRGKSAALSHALREAHSQIIVTIDADTTIAPNAISHLVKHFADPEVGAVAGNIKVGNRNRWLTRWQALEYITSQNLEKRAFDLLNCIPVVPGALSAWRADAIVSAGGFTSDTVAEDTDLTIAIRRAGWRIAYDEYAIGWTEAPETAAALISQRFRWTFGTLQSFWKHRGTLGRPRYGTLGFVALPNIFFFQLLLPLVSPVIDLLFVGFLALYGLAQLRITHIPQLWTAADVERSVIFFLGFMLIDFLTCVVAFALERHEDWTLLWPLLIQRFYYRQMMYVVLFRAVKHAVEGRAVGWRGVEPEVPSAPPTAPLAHV